MTCRRMGLFALQSQVSVHHRGKSRQELQESHAQAGAERMKTWVISACFHSTPAFFLLHSPAQPTKWCCPSLGRPISKDDQDNPHRCTHKLIRSGYFLFKTLSSSESRLSQVDRANQHSQLPDSGLDDVIHVHHCTTAG